ncbi:MAG: hypothetical protein LBG15_03845 [Dysgonamonadaceae bacterium]|jgi:hypothetical protein|nr:hypothetical protein [Dysgonamonadaceae bacterium]
MQKKIFINDLDIGLDIKNKLSERDLTVAWLARQIDFDISNLFKQLNNKHIYPELLFKISVALETDFFIAYSEKIKQITQQK